MDSKILESFEGLEGMNLPLAQFVETFKTNPYLALCLWPFIAIDRPSVSQLILKETIRIPI